jgi:hypothetical protein
MRMTSLLCSEARLSFFVLVIIQIMGVDYTWSTAGGLAPVAVRFRVSLSIANP